MYPRVTKFENQACLVLPLKLHYVHEHYKTLRGTQARSDSKPEKRAGSQSTDETGSEQVGQMGSSQIMQGLEGHGKAQGQILSYMQ